MFTLSVSSPTKVVLESWNLAKMTLIYVPKKLLKEKLKFARFLAIYVFSTQNDQFSINLPLIYHKTCEMAENVQISNFLLVPFLYIYQGHFGQISAF